MPNLGVSDKITSLVARCHVRIALIAFFGLMVAGAPYLFTDAYRLLRRIYPLKERFGMLINLVGKERAGPTLCIACPAP